MRLHQRIIRNKKALGVVTVNLPRIALKSRDKQEFINILKETTIISIKINNTKRHIIKKRIDNENLPLYNLGFMDLKKQYSTTGLVGIYEAVNFMGLDILTEDGQSFVKEILTTMNYINDKFSKQYNYMHNIEQVPKSVGYIIG